MSRRNDIEQPSLFDPIPQYPELYEQIQALPKADLHRHLTACIRYSTLLNAAKEQGKLKTYTEGKVKEQVLLTHCVHDVDTFIDSVWKNFNKIIKHVDIKTFFPKAILEAIEDVARDNILYVEFRTSPFNLMDLSGKVSGHLFNRFLISIEEGIRRARKLYPEITTHILISIPRHILGRQSKKVRNRYFGCLLDVCSQYRGFITGFDLTGKENHFPPERFGRFFKDAKALGFNITIHAGESDGPNRVLEAVNWLHADRIGHGITSINDDNVVNLLASKCVPLEICPTSNYRTGSITDLESHPVRKLYQRGVPITINTDDPQFLAPILGPERPLTLTDELYALYIIFGFSMDEIYKIVENGFRFAFMSADDRKFVHKIRSRKTHCL